MELLSMPVTLVVKAPNQRIGDQTVECALDWTIKKLKEHLSDAYPSKPKEHQQRLIYSGKLLQDHHTLKEVLRHSYDESQTKHTVHLVCSMTMSDALSQKKPAEEANTSSHVGSSVDTSATTLPESLRHRSSATQHQNTPTSAPQMPYHPYYNMMAGTMPQGVSGPQTPGWQYTPEQMMWYQQMYTQQMAQYMQYMQQYYPQVSGAVASSADSPVGPGVAPPPAAAAAQNNPQQQQNNNNQQMVMNAAGGQAVFEDEEEDVNRDWLDWSYILCRFAMLVAIVYFYSTLGRFFMVFGFFFLIYMYQAGWFQLNRRQQRQEPRPVQRPEQGQGQQPVPQDEAAQGQGGEGGVAETNGNEENAEVNNNNDNQSPSTFRVALSFFITFFTSLVPQQPGAVNAN